MKDDLVISQVANGYLVRPAGERGLHIGTEQTRVFENFASLTAFLRDHFEGEDAGKKRR